jgi:GNAT superfamily N-acetyltransferase
MPIQICVEPPETIAAYGSSPITFRVESQLRVVPQEGGLGGLLLVEESVRPYIKDYDAITGGPVHWPDRWDLSGWGFLAAFENGRRVGGAAVAHSEPSVVLTGTAGETAVLWDLRVDANHRGQGVGRQLFESALSWARERNCRRLEIETQNINVAACKFYARQGCELIAINRNAYPSLSHETQLIWQKLISQEPGSGRTDSTQ